MTIDKRSEITLPTWLVSVVLSVFTGVLIMWGGLSYLRNQAEVNKTNIETLRKEKIDRNEFNLVYNKLNSIEQKLDQHIVKEK